MHLSTAYLQTLFPTKHPGKVEQWAAVLEDNEFDTTADLQQLSDEEWRRLGLPLQIEKTLRAAARQSPPSSPAVVRSAEANEPQRWDVVRSVEAGSALPMETAAAVQERPTGSNRWACLDPSARARITSASSQTIGNNTSAPAAALSRESLRRLYPATYELWSTSTKYSRQELHEFMRSEAYRVCPSVEEWIVPFRLERPSCCLRLNHAAGYGCQKAGCTYEHSCLLCGRPGHGMWQQSKNGRYQCGLFQRYMQEFAKHGLGVEELEALFRGESMGSEVGVSNVEHRDGSVQRGAITAEQRRKSQPQ